MKVPNYIQFNTFFGDTITFAYIPPKGKFFIYHNRKGYGFSVYEIKDTWFKSHMDMINEKDFISIDFMEKGQIESIFDIMQDNFPLAETMTLELYEKSQGQAE